MDNVIAKPTFMEDNVTNAKMDLNFIPIVLVGPFHLLFIYYVVSLTIIILTLSMRL